MQRVRANCIGTLKTFCACEYPLPWDIGSCFPVVHRGDCAADECGVRAYTQRLDIALAPDCTEKQGTSEPARDGLVSPCLGLMCVVAQLTSPQVTSTHKTRASQWLCPKQNWTPAFPGGLESDPPLLCKVVQCIVRWTPNRFSPAAPFAGRRLNSPTKQGSGIFWVFDGDFGVFDWTINMSVS